MTIAIALMLSATAGKAQDTVYGLYTGDNYFYTNMVKEDEDLRCELMGGVDYLVGGVWAKYLDCGTDTLKVVGVAIPMITLLDLNGVPVESTWYNYYWYYRYHHTDDTTLENCFEHVILYKHEADPVRGFDTMRALDSVMVHRKHDTVKYVLKAAAGMRDELDYVPYLYLYEKRFASPITVTDTFYLGLTRHTANMRVDTSGREIEIRWERLDWTSLFYVSPRLMYEPLASFNGTQWRFYNQEPYLEKQYFYFFPILEADTAQPVSVETVERFTVLFPNPASARATVSSSFGLECVRVYNAAGVEVLRMDGLTGTSAALEVGSLPRGTYLVHIHTPAGTAVKRLAVP